MVFEAVQNYVSLVTGLSKATRAGARSGAREFLAQSGLEGAAGERVGKLAEEILSAGRANRELLENLVNTEVTRAVSRLGFVRSDDLDEVREEIAELRYQLDRQGQGQGQGAATAAAATKAAKRSTTASASAGPSTTTTPGKIAAAKRAAARTAAAAEAGPAGPAEPPRRARNRPPGKAPEETPDVPTAAPVAEAAPTTPAKKRPTTRAAGAGTSTAGQSAAAKRAGRGTPRTPDGVPGAAPSSPDTSTPDAGTPDAGTPDAGTPDGGSGATEGLPLAGTSNADAGA